MYHGVICLMCGAYCTRCITYDAVALRVTLYLKQAHTQAASDLCGAHQEVFHTSALTADHNNDSFAVKQVTLYAVQALLLLRSNQDH